jgi:hypothetical protein
MVLFNNCRGRNYAANYPREDAFYDLGTEGHDAALANYRVVGEECVVASYQGLTGEGRHTVVFRWYACREIDELQDNDGDINRVFCGEFLREEMLLKIEALETYPYADFFNINGNFLMMSVPPVRMKELLRDLLKWAYIENSRNAQGRNSVKSKREYLERRVMARPQLDPRSQGADWLVGAYADAARSFAQPMPDQCPWTINEIMNPDFWPNY